MDLLRKGPRVINIGLETFASHVPGAVHVNWRPPAFGDSELGRLLASLDRRNEQIAAANAEALRRMTDAQPVWIDVRPAHEVIPELTPTTLLHAGPPVDWTQMSGAQKGGVYAALLFEGLAQDVADAERLAASGRITFSPCHHHRAVGPMAGILSRSMPVLVVENRAAGNRAYSFFNVEGRGPSHTMGHFGPATVDALRWARDVLGPAMQKAVRGAGGLDLKAITARALQMGDEGHNRHVAATSLLVRLLLPHLARAGVSHSDLSEMGDFLVKNDWFFLNYSMAACKSAADAAHGVAGSTLVTAMARNGTEVGIRVSGLGPQWFKAPAPMVNGQYFPGFSEADAGGDIGDSAITETCGLGAFAMAAAPAIAQHVGGNVAEALAYTAEMREITMAEHPAYTIPHLNYLGVPTGVDIRKVVETGIAPVIDTAIAHRLPGRGMVGAGIVRFPLQCFVSALQAFAATQGEGGDRPA